MMDRSKSQLFHWLLQRHVHEYLDVDGRPVGEGRSAAYAAVETQFKTCPYPGSRNNHPHPMNMSALQSVTPEWQNILLALGWLGQRCQAFYGKPVSTYYDLALVSGAGVFLTDYLALRPDGLLQSPDVPVLLSGLYKVSLGFQQATFLAMMDDRFKTDAADKTLPDAKGFYVWLEQEQLLIGDAEVCAGSVVMISKAYDTMKGASGPVLDAPPAELDLLEVDWGAFDTFSTNVSNLWRKVILFVIQMHALRLNLRQADLAESYDALLGQQSGLAVELARLTLAESGRPLAEWADVQAEFLDEMGYRPPRAEDMGATPEAAIQATIAQYRELESAALHTFDQHLSAIQQTLGHDGSGHLTADDLTSIYGKTVRDWPEALSSRPQP